MSNEKKPRVATEAPTQNQSLDHFNVFGPVDKLKFLCIAAADASLSRSDLASLMTIANGANSKTGVTWRSSSTLARETASTTRTVKRSIKKLVEKGYVAITKKGNRSGKANTYSLGDIDVLAGGVADITTFADLLVTPATTSGDAGVTSDVTAMSHLSMTLSEPKARIERNRSSEGDALPCGVAGAPSGKRQPSGDIYPDFWNTFPFRAGVAAAEEILGKFIKDGIEYEAILAGAKRYAEYCKRSKIRTSANAWLRRQSWRDEWTPYVEAKESKEVRKNAKEKQKTHKRRNRVPSDEYNNWKSNLGKLSWEQLKAKQAWDKHYGLGTSERPYRCDICFRFDWHQVGAYCNDGANLKSAQEDAEAKITAHRNAKPDKGLHYRE